MESQDAWDTRVRKAASLLAFNEGYKILYSPWATIGATGTVFLSLNPGRAPRDAALSTLSDERGNSYEVEAATTRSPITKQFLALAERLSLRPAKILTGVVVPFRSGRWKDCSREQRIAALALGTEFWRQVFAVRRPERVFACGKEPAEIAAKLLHADLAAIVPSGWGSTKLRLYRAPDGCSIVQLPHLSTFKLFSRPECEKSIASVIADS